MRRSIRGQLVRSLEPKLRKFVTGGKIRKFSDDPSNFCNFDSKAST